MSSWLVTGGAGYIGAHVVRSLLDRGDSVVVVDDLSTGDAARLPGEVAFVEASVADGAAVRAALREHSVDGVVHIAARKQVGESVEQPQLYYRENVSGMQVLLDAVVAEGVRAFVFSSSAATYGMPDSDVVDEDAPLRPLSPYGRSKVVGEWMAQDVARATGLRAVALRYFNVAGAAAPDLGDPAALNLVPLVLRALTTGGRPQVFGDDYETPDGTCIRDYVHVSDVADAHTAATRAALDGVLADGEFRAYNIGRGVGSSVYDVIRVIGEVTGMDVSADVVARRPGDPARIVGRVDRIGGDLGWQAQRDLRDMVESAWAAWQHRPAVR